MITATKRITATQLREWRLLKGWTQAEMASRIGVHVRTLDKWEHAKEPFTLEVNELILEAEAMQAYRDRIAARKAGQ